MGLDWRDCGIPNEVVPSVAGCELKVLEAVPSLGVYAEFSLHLYYLYQILSSILIISIHIPLSIALHTPLISPLIASHRNRHHGVKW